MSKVISVRPDKLQLAISYYSEAWGRAGAKTMPTPLCDDQCLRRLCKMAAAKPTHYYESLALHFYPSSSSSLLSKEVPSVSDSGASAIYSECSKQICHFCISRAWMLAYYHWQGCLLSWEILSVVWYISSFISIFLVNSMPSSQHHSSSGTK